MPHYQKLLASVAIAALTVGAATADPILAPAPNTGLDYSQLPNPQADILNQQLQMGDVFSNLNVVVADTTDAVATSLAYGNTAHASQVNATYSVSSSQVLGSEVRANNYVDVGQASGAVIATTAAQANSVVADTCCGTLDGSVVQQIDANPAGAPIAGYADVNVQGAHDVNSGVVIGGNAASYAVSNGTINGYAGQVNYQSVRGENDIDIVYNSNTLTGITTVTGNAVGTTAENGTVFLDTEQRQYGQEIIANVDIYAQSGANAAGAATASANSVHATNTFGYAQASGYQENTSFVQAESFVTLDNWAGYGSSTAYGVGNSVLLGNTGDSDTRLDYTQNNFEAGEVVTIANFTGGAGGSVVTNATSIGNAITSSVCASCGTGAGLYGSSQQFNYANISAQTSVNTAYAAGGVNATAAAVGNSATYSSYSNGH